MKNKFLLTFVLLISFTSVFAGDMSSVMQVYEKLHSAFFNYDGAKVEIIAGELKKSINALGEGHEKKMLEFSSKQLESITSSNSRENNNKIFNTVSLALIHVLKMHSTMPEYESYNCPMLKMQWIQNTKKNDQVLNPYAPEMPHCGAKN